MWSSSQIKVKFMHYVKGTKIEHCMKLWDFSKNVAFSESNGWAILSNDIRIKSNGAWMVQPRAIDHCFGNFFWSFVIFSISGRFSIDVLIFQLKVDPNDLERQGYCRYFLNYYNDKLFSQSTKVPVNKISSGK